MEVCTAFLVLRKSKINRSVYFVDLFHIGFILGMQNEITDKERK